ncbi:PIN domain-containing protein [Magnetospirillum sp. 15-1]|uniref:PIN domain-containing protein n=1 Tax=Magnetospirillum sp. 15-1 TaxID=1979370 RepID=UPI000BBC5173|nr:PIN domain-containing protein [Magnetospirillum sp. 15-1]
MPGSFIDTNVLVYLASGDLDKADRAETVIRDGGAISVQVLNEFTHVARRKMRLSWTEIQTFLSVIRALLEVRPLTVEIHETGLALAERHSLSIWDAMIVASALHADCDRLWSEDMQDGRMIENRLRIANPFRPAS